MAKVDHLQQLKGRSFYGDDNRSTRRGKLRSFNKYVEVTPHQAKMLNIFIRNENTFYNLLVEHLNSRLKGSHEFFLELTDRNIELFSKIAFCNFDVTSLEGKKRKETPIPKVLHPYADILFGCHGDKEIGLSDKLKIFYETFAKKVSLLPVVRERMASELIDFCVEQAGTMSMNYGNDDEDRAYRFQPKALEHASIMQKRHVQLHKDDVQIVWNAPLEQTEITIPYVKKPLIIETLNLIEFYPDWTIMLIHQDPHDVLTTHSDWEIDIRTTKEQYIRTYLECPNPDSMMISRELRKRSR